MRRFYGYLILIVSLVLIVFSNVQTQIQKISSNIEYSSGYETLYKVELNENSSKTLDDISKIVVDRIEDAGVSNAVVTSESGKETGSNDDYIRIKMAGSSETDINYVLRSVEATGHITVSTLMDNENYPELDNPFDIGSACVKWNSSTPYVEIGIKDAKAFNTYMDYCNSDYKAFQEKYNSSDDDDEDTINGVMVIWLDKTDDDSYLSAYQAESEVDKTYTRKHILAIVPTNNFYVDEDLNGNYENPKLLISYYTFDQTQMDAQSVHTVERILNYGESDFGLTQVYMQRVDQTASSKSGYDQIVLWGEVIALVVLLVILVIRYGVAGLSGFASVSVSFIAQLFLFNYLSFTFSTMTAIGLITSLVVNAAAVIAYLERFKNELYKGKSAIKANQEANKSTLVNVIDASVFGLLITIVGILVFSSEVKTLPITVCIGVGCSLILNRLTMIFSMWWVSNNKLALEKPSIFRVKKTDIPDVMKMEPQRKFAPLYNAEPKKYGKGSVIAASVTSVVCAVLLAVMALIPGVGVFNTGSETKSYSRIEISSEVIKEEYLFSKKDDAYAFFKNNYPQYEVSNIEVVRVDDTVGSSTEELVDIAYITVELKDVVSGQAGYDFLDDLTAKLKEEKHVDAEKLTVDVVKCNDSSVNNKFKAAIIAVSVFAALAIAFVLVRFGYVYALSSLITVIPTALVSLGFFAATRIAINAISLAGIAAGLMIVVLAQLPLYERIKRLKREAKPKVTTYEQREAIGIQAYKETIFTSLMISGIALVAIIVVACFSPFTSSVLSSYATMAIAVIVGAVFTYFLLIPVYLFLQKTIRLNIHIDHTKRNIKAMEKAKKENRNSGSEPEESKIPGINC